jgi:hypothetical protein
VRGEWPSDSWIRCKVSESSGGSWRAVLTVGGRAGSLTEAWSVDVAGISEVVGLNVAAAPCGLTCHWRTRDVRCQRRPL